MTVYETRRKVTRTEEEGEIIEPEVVAIEVKEQRISHFIMGLALIGTMTGPLLVVLHTVPRALFAGVFFVVGVSTSSFQALNDALITSNSGVVSKATISPIVSCSSFESGALFRPTNHSSR